MSLQHHWYSQPAISALLVGGYLKPLMSKKLGTSPTVLQFTAQYSHRATVSSLSLDRTHFQTIMLTDKTLKVAIETAGHAAHACLGKKSCLNPSAC